MGIWSRVFGLGPVSAALADEPTATFAVDQSAIDPALFGLDTWYGVDAARIAVPVTREEALQVPAVLQARQIIAGTIGTLPLEVHDKTRNVVDAPFVAQPDPRISRSALISYTVEDLMFEGEAWWRVTGFAWDGYPARANRVEPWRVDCGASDGKARVDGVIVPDAELIRFVSPNPPLLRFGARAIRNALKLDLIAENYADNPQALGYFTPADGVDDPEESEVQAFLDDFAANRRARSYAYIGSALKFNPAGARFSPAELQLADARNHAVLEVARAFGLDAEDLNVSTTSRTYANSSDRRLDRVNTVLAPYMSAISERLSMPDVTPRGRYVVFDLDDFLKADPATRWTTYATALGTQALTISEVRKAEDLPDLGVAPLPVPAPLEAPLNNTGHPVNFARETGLEFHSPVTDAAFSVDEEARTITGLAVPWNTVATKNGRKFTFTPNSLVWKDPGRVKMLNDHDNTQPIGKAVSLQNTDEGLQVKFRIARGPEGDKALALAADGVKDGLSVGVDFTDDGFETDGDSVKVNRAALREVTLTAMPAYDDARVTTVAASYDQKGTPMHCTKCGLVHAPGVVECASAPAANAVDLSAISTAITEGFARLPQREVIPATGGLQISEPEPYYIDRKGNIRPGKFEFSSDVIAGAQGDRDAESRALGFMASYMGFDVATTNTTALTPNIQRPDLYVDQRDYPTPLWDRVNRGTLTDNTPFVLPQFNSAATLVSNHTEGVEPSAGTFTTTSQTVTPQAVSGKIPITRELWDRGGNPQVSALLWAQMTKMYMEALEAYVVTVLEAASPTTITLTTAEADTTLADDLQGNFVALQYQRGGFAFDTFAVQIDLYKKLALAKDSTGRRLFPMYGPMNATGQARPLFGSLDVGGIEAIPSWALAATGTVAANSYLFDRYSVNFWASAPQRLQFEYRVAFVDLGIWGYKAGAVTDVSGVRRVTYDPV